MDLYAVRLSADQTPVALCWADSTAEVATYVDAHCGQDSDDYEFVIVVGGAAIFWDNPTGWRIGVKEPLTPEQEDGRETEVANGLTFFLGASDDWLDLFVGGDLEWVRLPQPI
jgi:hypothetical protein